MDKFLRTKDYKPDDKLDSLKQSIGTELSILHEALQSIVVLDEPPIVFKKDKVKAWKALKHLQTLIEKDDIEANSLFEESSVLLQQNFGSIIEQIRQQ